MSPTKRRMMGVLWETTFRKCGHWPPVYDAVLPANNNHYHKHTSHITHARLRSSVVRTEKQPQHIEYFRRVCFLFFVQHKTFAREKRAMVVNVWFCALTPVACTQPMTKPRRARTSGHKTLTPTVRTILL